MVRAWLRLLCAAMGLTGRFSVASVYGPVTMPPCPLLVFKEARDSDGNVTGRSLVATGQSHAVPPPPGPSSFPTYSCP